MAAGESVVSEAWLCGVSWKKFPLVFQNFAQHSNIFPVEFSEKDPAVASGFSSKWLVMWP